MNVKLQNTGEENEEMQVAPASNQAIDAALQAAEVVPNGSADEDADEASDDNLKAQTRKYLSKVASIGKEHGTGKRALTTLALTIVEGAQEQVIKPDEAEKYYRKFRVNSDKRATIESGRVIGAEGSEGSWKAQVSKLRAFIKYGNEWRDDGLTTMDRAVEVHAELLANEQDKKSLKLTSTYSALVAVAREHMKKDTRKGVPMDDEELRGLFLGKEPTTKVGADYIEAAIKSIRQAQKGKAHTDEVPGRDAVEHAGLDRAIEELREVLGHIAPDRLEALIKSEQKAKDAAEQAAKAEVELADDDDEAEEAAAE
jgi:hypothetical protein